MSGLAGIFNRNLAPTDPDTITGMLNVVTYRGPDGKGIWRDGPVSLGHLMLATTPESTNDHQPLVDNLSGLTITFDGRIDNREEIVSAIEARDIVLKTKTDSEITLKAYECWGKDCVIRIKGDFAFALWDSNKQQLFCARDIMGVKPFYYHCSETTFLFGSELRQMFEYPELSYNVNEGMIGEYLAGTIVSREETIYRDIFRLQPAHVLIVDPSHFKLYRYWDIEPNKSIKYQRDEEYLEHFLELLQKAVSNRLRSNGKIGASMSGGRDSPLVVSMAQRILQNKGRHKPFETFSTTFPGKGDDEICAIETITDYLALHATQIPYSHTLFQNSPNWQQLVSNSGALPENPLTLVNSYILKSAESRKIRVLLSGMGADSILGGSSYPYFELLRGFELGNLFCELHYHIRVQGLKSASSQLSRSLAWPLLPVSFRRYLESSHSPPERFGFLTHGFIKRIQLHKRLKKYDCAHRFSNLAKWDVYRTLMSGARLLGREEDERSSAMYGIEERHPFLDRDLIDFATAIPDFQHRFKDQYKKLMGAASQIIMPGIEPERDFPPHFNTCVKDALMSEPVKHLIRSLAINDRDWVSNNNIIKVYNELISNYNPQSDAPVEDFRILNQLTAIFSVNLWYYFVYTKCRD